MNKKKLVDLHKQGLTNKAIADKLGFHYNTISYHLKKLNLKSNWGFRKKVKIVGKDKAECSKCGEIKDLSKFLLCRKGQKYEYRLSFCTKCRQKQANLLLNNNIRSFFVDRISRTKYRAEKFCMRFNLDVEYLIDLYNQQNGNCFYTGYKMEWVVGKGKRRNALSLDKLIPEDGYVKGNVVLCCNFINTVKYDLSLKEVKMWMPIFYKKIEEYRKNNGI